MFSFLTHIIAEGWGEGTVGVMLRSKSSKSGNFYEKS